MLFVGFGWRTSVKPRCEIVREELGVVRMIFWYLCDRWANRSLISDGSVEGSKYWVLIR